MEVIILPCGILKLLAMQVFIFCARMVLIVIAFIKVDLPDALEPVMIQFFSKLTVLHIGSSIRG